MFVERILAKQVGLPATAPRTPHPTNSVTPLRIGGSQGLLWMWVETAGVLYEDTCWWRWLAQVLGRMGFHVPHDHLRETWTGHWESTRCESSVNDEFWHVLTICLEQIGLSRACTQEVLAAAVARHKQPDYHARPFRGITSTLAQLLQAGVQLAALSDAQCSRERWLADLHRLSVNGPFLHFFAATACGRSLRQAIFYRETLQQLRLEAADVVLVSSRESHLRAAVGAGLSTVAIACPQQVPADLHLELFTDLRCGANWHCCPRRAA